MRLLILSDGAVYKQSGKYYSEDTFLRFIQNLSEYFEDITLSIPVSNSPLKKEKLLFKLFESWDSSNLKIIETYPYRTVINFYRKLPLILIKNLPLLTKAVKNSDIVFLRLPAMNAFLVSLLSLFYNKPVVCYVVGSEEEVVEKGLKYRGILKKLASNIAHLHSFIYKKIVQRSKVAFFLSGGLKTEFGSRNDNSYLMLTSLMAEKDIQVRNDTIQNDTVTLLYVGRLAHEKGLDYLIYAIANLVHEGFKVKLLIGGEGPEREKLESLSRELGLDTTIEFLGFIPFGKELDEIYIMSDIFVLPSFSEGAPKVLLEAMAKGLPLISTDVGGVSDIIKDEENGILIQPRSSEAIAHAVKRVTKESKLRKKLIKNGYRFVEGHTSEKQAKKIAEIIYYHCGYSNLQGVS